MESGVADVSDALAATLAVDEPTRRAAEDALARMPASPAHVAELLRLAAAPDRPVVAAAAALRLKNAARAARSPPPSTTTTTTTTTNAAAAAAAASNAENAAGASTSTTTQQQIHHRQQQQQHHALHQTPVALSPEARAHVRAHLLPALATATTPAVPAALAEALRWLVLLDFPARWPELMPQIQAFLASGDLRQLAAALAALHKIAKCYEFRSNEPARLDANDPNDAGIAHPREPLDKIVAATFPKLLNLFLRLDEQQQQQQQHDAASTAAGGGVQDAALESARECQKLIVKIFWCSMQFMMPPHLAEPGVFKSWMDMFIAVFQRPVHVPAAMAGCDDTELATLAQFKIKKWIGNVLLRMLKRYGMPKRIPIDEPHTRMVSTIFHDQYAASATAAMLQVLSWPSNGHRLSGRVANIAIDYLQEAVETAALWAVILPHIQLLLSRIIFPYLCFSDEDAELWDSDPIEYVRKQTDMAEDYSSPRVAAMNLFAQLGELRPTNTVLPFMTHLVTNVLEPYRASAVASPERAVLARQKVGAMQALSACKLRLKSKPDLSAAFLNVLVTHVEPDLRSEFSFLRAAANKLLGDVASMGWDAFSKKIGEAALHGAVTSLDDPEIPVQAMAGAALHFLMEQDAARPMISPYAPQLLERLLILMDRMSDGFVTLLPTLDKLVDRYPDQLMPLAVPLMRRLVAAFQHSAAEAKAGGEDEEGDDDLLFQAAQILQLISSVLTTAGEWQKPNDEERKTMFAVLEKELQPVIHPMFDEGNQVFAEETLDVLHTLILQTGELKSGVSSFLLSMVPRLVQSFDTWAGEYVSSDIVGPVEAYIAFDLDGLLSINALPALMSIAQRLWSDMFDDSEALDGAKIADALILGLARHKSRGSELSSRVVVNLARDAAKKCMATEDREGPLRVRLFGTVMLAMYYDAELIIKELGGGAQVMQLISSVVSNLDLFTRIHDKKAVVLGLSAMLRVTGLGLDQTSPELVRGIIGLQNRIDQQRAGDEYKNAQMNQLASWAAHGGNPVLDVGGASESQFAAHGLNGSTQANDTGSELGDDEDASNRLLDGDDQDGLNVLEKLSEETGIPVAELAAMNSTGGAMTTGGFLDFDDVNDDDDEGDNPTSVLDEIDETRFFVESVKAAMSAPWWKNVGQDDRNAIDRLAQRLPLSA